MAGSPAMITALVLVSLLFSGASASAHAQGEHQRRFAVELRLLAGDLRRLDAERLPAHQVDGLYQRLRGSIGYLWLLGREAVQERAEPDPQLALDVAKLREAFGADNRSAMATPLARLLVRYPLVVTDFTTAVSEDGARLAIGRDIDRRFCMGCHLAPNPAAPNPAPNLFADARSMSREEFVARLIGGVRGVPDTALDNPFTDEELRGLYAWYRNGSPP